MAHNYSRMTASTSKELRGMHLVGSLFFESTEEAFRQTSALVGDCLTRLPDGETGDRYNWIVWQYPFLAQNPFLEEVPADLRRYGQLPRVRIHSGVSPQEIHIDDLGYAKAAKTSYALFSHLKQEGVIPAHMRFQVSLPSPLATITTFVEPEDQESIDPIYTAALFAELADIAHVVPSEELAIQWDVATEFLLLEQAGGPGYISPFVKTQADILARLVVLGEQVPTQVQLGYHLCYGDAGHKHFVEPRDTALLVEIANGIAAGVTRSLDWIHMPVPRDRSDEAYYQPLQNLRLHSETTLYLGLVHYEPGDQIRAAIEEAQQKIDIAHRFTDAFGIATECGMGRRTTETVLSLLQIHRALVYAQ